MPNRSPKRPRDPNQLRKPVVDLPLARPATGPRMPTRTPAAVALEGYLEVMHEDGLPIDPPGAS